MYEEIKQEAFNDELESIVKQAGPISEAVGTVLWGPFISGAGAVAGAATGKLSDKERKTYKNKSISNILIPGAGGYRLTRRFMS